MRKRNTVVLSVLATLEILIAAMLFSIVSYYIYNYYCKVYDIDVEVSDDGDYELLIQVKGRPRGSDNLLPVKFMIRNAEDKSVIDVIETQVYVYDIDDDALYTSYDTIWYGDGVDIFLFDSAKGFEYHTVQLK